MTAEEVKNLVLPNAWEAQYSKTTPPEGSAYYGRRPGQKYPPLVDLLGRTEEGKGRKIRQKKGVPAWQNEGKDDEQWSLLSMERRTGLRAPVVAGHTAPRRPLLGITKNNLN